MTLDDPSAEDDTENPNNATASSPWWKRVDWNLIVQILLFVVGIKVALIYSGQLEEMRKSTEAAKGAADTAQKTLIITNRSWLETTLDPSCIKVGTPIKKARDDFKTIACLLNITNIGRSPVKNISIVAAAEVREKGEATNFTYGGAEKRMVNTITNNLIFPDKKTQITAGLYKIGKGVLDSAPYEEVTPELREDLRLGKKYFVFYARGTFEDDLGRHWFNYCGWLALAEVGETYSSRNCTDYNGTGDFKD